MIWHLPGIVQRAVDFENYKGPRLGKVFLPSNTNPTVGTFDESRKSEGYRLMAIGYPFPGAELPVAAPTLPPIPLIPWQQ
jgi:hypothetical protein